MDKLDVRSLEKNVDAIKRCFKDVDNSTMATEDFSVLFPARYIDISLANLDSKVTTIGFCVIINSKQEYGTIQVPIKIDFSPREVKDIEIDGVLYKRMIFLKGDIVVPYRFMRKNDDVLYVLFKEFILLGKVPWFLTYEDVAGLLRQSKKYTDHKLGNDTLPIEFMTAVIARNPKNVTDYIRYKITTTAAKENPNTKYIGLNTVSGLDNTGSLLIGNYFVDSLTTAIVNDPKKNSPVADILRG